MNKAVIYARFSCSKQREASIEDQLRVCRAWCAKEGFSIVHEYCDHAISGRTDDRPEFQRMIANGGESDIVLVYMMDRFSRDEYDAPMYKKMLRDAGVRVVSATEAIPDSPEAVLLEKIYEGLAAVESAHISARTRRGMEGNAMKCMHNGVRVFGYSYGPDGRYVVDEDEAAIVRECFDRRRRGEAVNAIARSLAARGVETTLGKPAGHTFVANMLKNEKYTGVYIWGGFREEGGMPEIIPRSLFDAVQGTRSKKVRADESWRDFPLVGTVTCGRCGNRMHGSSAHGRGKRYDYYKCKCGAKAVRADWLEESVADSVRAMLEDRATALEVARVVSEYAVSDSEARVSAIAARRRADEAMKAIDNLAKAVAQGMEWDDAKDEMAKHKERYAAANAEADMYENASSFDVEDFADFLQCGATLDDRQLTEAMVRHVFVDEEGVTVLLNYDQDGEPAGFSYGSESFAPGVDEGQKERSNQAKPWFERNCHWLPIRGSSRNLEVGCLSRNMRQAVILLRFPRCA